MQNAKHYVVDTNVLLEDPGALFKLRNGNENNVYIPYHVLLELDKFKKNPKLGHIVAKVIEALSDHPDQFTVLPPREIARPFADLVDNFILEEVRQSGLDEPILVTNDRFFQLQADLRGIKSEAYKESVPFKTDAEYYTGFVPTREEAVANSFLWEMGKPVFFAPDGEKVIDYQHKIWNVAPRNVYQNLALELMTHPEIHVVSIQSDAGYGKSFLALAAALYHVLERKTHEKIYMVKPMIEIGQKLGYLPGKVSEKMEPYT
ncbi:MAG: PIN domain-containing protein, partial [Thermodesulfobacteriota bacterium]